MSAPFLSRAPVPTRSRRVFVLSVLYWTVPSLLCVFLYWYGLRAGYRKDDFAWLALHLHVHDIPSFFGALFQPLAQGTFRFLSERLFFLLAWAFFGLEAAPVRAAVFVTQFANLILLAVITRRLTGSRVAGFTAPLLWIANANLYAPMTWTSAYNQILCALFLLLAFYLFLRYAESGDRRFYAAQWAAFLLGFGALEVNIMYPALAAAYALLCARRYLLSTLPMFAVSAAYGFWHRMVAPPLQTDLYRMYFDASILRTLFDYVVRSAGAAKYADSRDMNVVPFYAAQALVLVAAIGFLFAMMARRRWLAAFFAAWFFLTLAPVLPLRNHVEDYYLTIPAIGLAMLGACAFGMAARRGRGTALLVGMLLAAYAVPSAWAGRAMTRNWFELSRRVQIFLRSVAGAHRLHSDKAIVVRNVDNALYWHTWSDNAFRLFGRNNIYLSSDSASRITPISQFATPAHHVLGDSLVLAGLDAGNVVVYEVIAGDRLRNDTVLTHARLARDPDLQLPKYLDIGSPLASPQAGQGWWPLEAGYRWMSKHASLKLRGPLTPGGMLIISGRCPPQQVASGPLHLTVAVDGRRLPPSRIDVSNLAFRFRYPLPEAAVRVRVMKVDLEVERTISVPGDERQLGLAFGTFEVIP